MYREIIMLLFVYIAYALTQSQEVTWAWAITRYTFVYWKMNLSYVGYSNYVNEADDTSEAVYF